MKEGAVMPAILTCAGDEIMRYFNVLGWDLRTRPGREGAILVLLIAPGGKLC
jgi:hypothetical protein